MGDLDIDKYNVDKYRHNKQGIHTWAAEWINVRRYRCLDRKIYNCLAKEIRRQVYRNIDRQTSYQQ